MGISLNGAKKTLYCTGNRSVNTATNWIFDHPELDLETPLEEEIKRLQTEELEEDCLKEVHRSRKGPLKFIYKKCFFFKKGYHRPKSMLKKAKNYA